MPEITLIQDIKDTVIWSEFGDLYRDIDMVYGIRKGKLGKEKRRRPRAQKVREEVAMKKISSQVGKLFPQPNLPSALSMGKEESSSTG